MYIYVYICIPSGKLNIAIENCPFIVDLPIKHGDFPSFFVGLPHHPGPLRRLGIAVERVHGIDAAVGDAAHRAVHGANALEAAERGSGVAGIL